MDLRPDTLQDRFEEFNLYTDFVVYYVSAVIGMRHFEKEKCRSKYSEYVTVSDEAFTVLTIENNWMRWTAMAKSKHWKDSPVRTKWTVTRDKPAVVVAANAKHSSHETELPHNSNGIQDGPLAQRFRGWSAHGINRYNQLFDEIKTERKSVRGQRFEQKLQDHFRNEALLQTSGRKKKQKTLLATLPTPKHELWVLSPPAMESLENEEVDNGAAQTQSLASSDEEEEN
jgi:hypothetical protein